MTRKENAKARANRVASYVYSRLGRGAFVLFAAVFSALIVIDFSYTHLIGVMERKTYDLMMRNRYRAPAPDRDIVIIDIDEKSLAAMAKDYGRWPWPRQVLAELVQGIEEQRPAAIVFDILFSDADVVNAESDAYFNRAMAATRNTYFPYLRLDRRNDALSQVTAAMLPGAQKLAGDASVATGIAVVLPRFPALIESGRLGLHNVEPDRDSVIRNFRPWLDEHGWRLPSVPLAVAQGLGWPRPAEERFLINWRGAPFSYTFAAFSDVYEDLLRKDKRRPQDEFAGKVVLIGSTAPSLFDIKATPMASIHPGVEILANVIDNLKHGDYYLEHGRTLYALLSLAFVWGLACAFLLRVRSNVLAPVFVVLQGALVAISYFSLSFSSRYVDLTAPISFGLLYFTAAKVYSTLSERVLTQRGLFVERLAPAQTYVLTLLVLQSPAGDAKSLRSLRTILDKAVTASRAGARRVARMLEGGGALETLFGDIALLYWICPAAQAERAQLQVDEAKRLRVELSTSLGGMQLRAGLHSESVEADAEGRLGKDARRLLLVALAGISEV